MIIKSHFCFIYLLAILLVGCKKNDTPSSNVYANADVYLVGTSSYNSGDQVTYWKNGVPTYLAEGGGKAIFVNGSDIYVAGYSVDQNGNSIATYWKNGIATNLTQALETNVATAITVKGTDVYVTGITMNGYGQDVAVFWKNGIITYLPGSSKYYSSSANTIVIVGNDVYVGGFTTDDNDNYIPTYWKNGVPVYLSNNSSNGKINAIAVNGADVYAAGSSNNTNYNYSIAQSSNAVYWKNGIEQTIVGTTNNSEASDLLLNGNDLYIAGGVRNTNNKFVTTYWKNGTAKSLPLPNTSYSEYSTTKFAMLNNDVYLTGQSGENFGFWKNNIAVQIMGNVEYISGIQVVAK